MTLSFEVGHLGDWVSLRPKPVPPWLWVESICDPQIWTDTCTDHYLQGSQTMLTFLGFQLDHKCWQLGQISGLQIWSAWKLKNKLWRDSFSCWPLWMYETPTIHLTLQHFSNTRWTRCFPDIKDINLIVQDKETITTHRYIWNCTTTLCLPQPCCLNPTSSIPVRATEDIDTVILTRKKLRSTHCKLRIAPLFTFWDPSRAVAVAPSQGMATVPHVNEPQVVKLVHYTHGGTLFHRNRIHHNFLVSTFTLTRVCPRPYLKQTRDSVTSSKR